MGTLSYLHVIAGDFNAALYAFLKGPTIEGFVKHIYSDGLGIPTLGVGFALATKDGDVYKLKSNLADLLSAAGITLTDPDRALLQQAVDALNKEQGAVNPIPDAYSTNNPFQFISSSGTPGIINGAGKRCQEPFRECMRRVA